MQTRERKTIEQKMDPKMDPKMAQMTSMLVIPMMPFMDLVRYLNRKFPNTPSFQWICARFTKGLDIMEAHSVVLSLYTFFYRLDDIVVRAYKCEDTKCPKSKCSLGKGSTRTICICDLDRLIQAMSTAYGSQVGIQSRLGIHERSTPSSNNTKCLNDSREVAEMIQHGSKDMNESKLAKRTRLWMGILRNFFAQIPACVKQMTYNQRFTYMRFIYAMRTWSHIVSWLVGDFVQLTEIAMMGPKFKAGEDEDEEAGFLAAIEGFVQLLAQVKTDATLAEKASKLTVVHGDFTKKKMPLMIVRPPVALEKISLRQITQSQVKDREDAENLKSLQKRQHQQRSKGILLGGSSGFPTQSPIHSASPFPTSQFSSLPSSLGPSLNQFSSHTSSNASSLNPSSSSPSSSSPFSSSPSSTGQFSSNSSSTGQFSSNLSSTGPSLNPSSSNPSSLGPSLNQFSSSPSSSLNPSSLNPSSSNPSSLGPSLNQVSSNPSSLGPSLNPSSLGPSFSNPSSTGQFSSNPISSNPSSTGQFSSNPSSLGPSLNPTSSNPSSLGSSLGQFSSNASFSSLSSSSLSSHPSPSMSYASTASMNPYSSSLSSSSTSPTFYTSLSSSNLSLNPSSLNQTPSWMSGSVSDASHPEGYVPEVKRAPLISPQNPGHTNLNNVSSNPSHMTNVLSNPLSMTVSASSNQFSVVSPPPVTAKSLGLHF